MKAGFSPLVVMLALVGTAGAQYPWQEMTPLPATPSGKMVDDGGCLVPLPSDSVDRIWAAKGNATTDAYLYDMQTLTWEMRCPVPLGVENKAVGIGARAAYDGQDCIFMTKGNYCQGFYRYSLSGDTWWQLSDVPLGPRNTKVQQGSDMVYVNRAGHGYVYLLKGYWNDFYRYDVEAQAWEILVPAPVGVNAHYYDGSWLVYDGGSTIYCHKAKYHEFYTFDLDSLTWSGPLTAMPVAGSSGSHKTGDGGCAAWLDSSIYALKGNFTTEFWRYYVAANVWYEAETMPPIGSTGKVKRVCDGADIVSAGGRLYALKGNSTNEFWCYDPLLSGVSESGPRALRRGAIRSNPVMGGRVSVSLPWLQTGSCRVTVCDAAGRVLRSDFAVLRDGQFGVDVSGVPAGAYVLRISAPGVEFAEPLVVAR
jgi:hypothetical protein